MPVLYGHEQISSDSISSSYDLAQYTKWFALNGCSFSLTFTNDAWRCRAWLGDSFVSSDQHEAPVSAMHECYAKMRKNGKG